MSRIFGLNNFPNPNFSIDYFLKSESKNPEWADNPTFKIVSHDTIAFSDNSRDDFIYKDIGILRDRIERDSQYTIYIAINPNIDLAKQLSKAAKLLKDDEDIISTRRKISVDQPATRRNTQPKWQRYLRLLDAREAGASWAQMAVLLDPGKRDPSQAARNAWNSAVEVRRRLCCLD